MCECFQGSPNVSFCKNPQYRITLSEPDKDNGKCTIIVGLLQKLRRQQRHLGVKNLGISFDVFRVSKICYTKIYGRCTYLNKKEQKLKNICSRLLVISLKLYS